MIVARDFQLQLCPSFLTTCFIGSGISDTCHSFFSVGKHPDALRPLNHHHVESCRVRSARRQRGMAMTAVHGAVGTAQGSAPSRLSRARCGTNPRHSRTSRPQQPRHHTGSFSRHLPLRSSRERQTSAAGAVDDNDLATPAATDEHELVLGMG